MKKDKPHKPKGKTQPIRKKEDVQKSNDEHIDSDFPGFPHSPSTNANLHNGSAHAFEATENPSNDE